VGGCVGWFGSELERADDQPAGVDYGGLVRYLVRFVGRQLLHRWRAFTFGDDWCVCGYGDDRYRRSDCHGGVVSVQYSVSNGLTALAAATAKSIVEINPGASIPAELVALDVSSSYLTSGTPISLLVELGTASATGTGSSYTPKKFGQAVGTALSTVKINDTVEPTSFVTAVAWEIVLPSGPFCYQWPLGREYFLAISTVNVVRLTASAICSVIVNAIFEE
jgi:hypothetical protein